MLQLARQQIDSRRVDNFILTKTRDDFEPTPKHLSVTKRLYKPYDRFFTIDAEALGSASRQAVRSRTHQISKSMCPTSSAGVAGGGSTPSVSINMNQL